ncbi:hypothetical protein P9D57_18080 [Bacillus sonorensis]|uniref:hypothetical protein n=1 Tax=Bacillus sonorensis TaxID=119858 RepID=UPI002DBE2DD9|nr:hypothetical protein [Bacillus sonorensis]MEC1440602.1 hypothetical protein [Bacillus sonorensis]
MDSLFSKIVDLLTAINELEKRGHRLPAVTPTLLNSLIKGAVAEYNSTFGPKPPVTTKNNNKTQNSNQHSTLPPDHKETEGKINGF